MYMQKSAQMLVVGIDEVGRGCWAGPLLVVAARAPTDLPAGLKDSKLLTSLQRTALVESIKSTCELGEGWVQPEEIDQHGLAQAMRIGVARALLMLVTPFKAEIIIDGAINYCPAEYSNVRPIIKADLLHPVVSAASVYAKVKRDQYMTKIARLYPAYQFDKHVGYGTKLHLDMLRLHGVSKLHRLSYKPVKQFIIES